MPGLSPSPDGEVPATFYRLDFGFEESPSVGQQMPEALRKRLENRKEQLVQQQQKKLQPEKGAGEKSTPTDKNEKFFSEKNEKLEKKLEKNDEKSFLDDKASPSKASTRVSVTRARPGDEIPPLALESCSRKRRSNSIGGTRRASREEGILSHGAATARSREKHEKPGSFGTQAAPRSGKCPEKIFEKGEVGVPNSAQGGRQMFDKNTLRMMHREVFKGAIGRYQQRMLECHGSIFDVFFSRMILM